MAPLVDAAPRCGHSRRKAIACRKNMLCPLPRVREWRNCTRVVRRRRGGCEPNEKGRRRDDPASPCVSSGNGHVDCVELLIDDNDVNVVKKTDDDLGNCCSPPLRLRPHRRRPPLAPKDKGADLDQINRNAPLATACDNGVIAKLLVDEWGTDATQVPSTLRLALFVWGYGFFFKIAV